MDNEVSSGVEPPSGNMAALTAAVQGLQGIVASLAGGGAPTGKGPSYSKGGNQQQQGLKLCFNCGLPGHLAFNCRNPPKGGGKGGPSGPWSATGWPQGTGAAA